MRNVSDKKCTVNQNTHFMFENLFPHYEGMWENMVEPNRSQVTNNEEKMCPITKARIQTYTNNISHLLLHY
jgi:hypothetical protein